MPFSHGMLVPPALPPVHAMLPHVTLAMHDVPVPSDRVCSLSWLQQLWHPALDTHTRKHID